MIRMRIRQLPVSTALALAALDAGIDPARIFNMTVREFVDAIAQAKQRKVN